MRKYALFLCLISSLFSTAGEPRHSDESKKYAVIDSIFEHAGVSDFLEMAATVREGKEAALSNPFVFAAYPLREKRELWLKFFPVEYASGLRKQFMDLFTLKQLDQVARFYENPFRRKILVILNTEAFAGRLFANKTPELRAATSKNKMNLIQSLANLHKLNQIFHDQSETLKTRIRKKRKLKSILNKGKPSEVSASLVKEEALLKGFKKRTAFFLARAFEKTRESELREMVRVMKDKTLQDAGQLLVSYHYFFLKNKELLAAY